MQTTVILAAEAVTSYQVPPLWRLTTKFLYFAALAGVIGGTWTALTAAAPLRGGASDRRLRGFLAASGGFLVVAAYLQLAGRVMRGGHESSFAAALAPSATWRFLGAPAKGGEWFALGDLVAVQSVLVVVVAGLLAAGLLRWVRDRRGVDRGLRVAAGVAAVAVTLVVSVPTGPAKATADAVLGSVMVQFHIVGGSLWLGGLALLAALAPADRRRGHPEARAWIVVWRRFGVVAMVAVALVVVSGLWLTWESVGSPVQLWTTVFGRVLLVKVALVAAMVAAGAYNQLVLLPEIGRAREAGDDRALAVLVRDRFGRIVAAETVVGVGVLAAVPFLAGSAREEVGDAHMGELTASGLALGMLVVATVALAFWVTAMASDRLSAHVTPVSNA